MAFEPDYTQFGDAPPAQRRNATSRIDQPPALQSAASTAMATLQGGQTMQRVQTQYTTAMMVQRPRDLRAVIAAVEYEARMLGDSAMYSWGQGKDRVSGSSIKMANVLARVWGNCAIEVRDIQETADAWYMTAVFIDLETGQNLARPSRMSRKWTIYGRHDPERKEEMRFNIGASKATRNVILNALPEWLIQKAQDAAQGRVREQLEARIAKASIDGQNGLHVVQDQCIGKLESLGALEPRVLASMGVANRRQLQVAELVQLTCNIRAIQDGAESWESLFPVDAAAAAAEQAKSASKTANAAADKARAAMKATPKAASNESPPEQIAPEPPAALERGDWPEHSDVDTEQPPEDYQPELPPQPQPSRPQRKRPAGGGLLD